MILPLIWVPKSILHTSSYFKTVSSPGLGVQCAAQLLIEIPVGNAMPLSIGFCGAKVLLQFSRSSQISANLLPGLIILCANLLTCLWISAAFLKLWIFSSISSSFAFSSSDLTLGTAYSIVSFQGQPVNWLLGNLNLTGFCQPLITRKRQLVWVGAVSYQGVMSATTGRFLASYQAVGAVGFFFFLLFFFFFFFFFYSVVAVPSAPSFYESLPYSYWFQPLVSSYFLSYFVSVFCFSSTANFFLSYSVSSMLQQFLMVLLQKCNYQFLFVYILVNLPKLSFLFYPLYYQCKTINVKELKIVKNNKIDQIEFKQISFKCLAIQQKYKQFRLKKMHYRASSRPNTTKPTKANIKQLLQAARSKCQTQKRNIQQLMNRDIHTSALLHTQASQSQLLWTQIEKIRSGNIGPEMEGLKNDITGVLDEGIRSGTISSVTALSRLEPAQLGKFMQLLSNKRNGLSFSFIEAIPVLKYPKDTRPAEEICAVCHQEFEEGVECIELECKHLFHKNCISQWLKLKRNCPMCKKEVRVENPRGRDENVNWGNVRGGRERE